jgi:hypothetical protein
MDRHGPTSRSLAPEPDNLFKPKQLDLIGEARAERVIKASWPWSDELQRPSSTTTTRYPWSTASSTVASTQTSVSDPETTRLLISFFARKDCRGLAKKAPACR